MTDFMLDTRLAADCIILGEMRLSLLLLMNNSLVPWFILVPRRNEIELCELSRNDQLALLDEINHLSGFLKGSLKVEKLNVAALGNVVRQLHVHVVGRSSTDFRWPGVVWGSAEKKPYTPDEIAGIRESLEKWLPADSYSPVRTSG